MIDDAWRGHDLAPFLYRGAKDQTTRLVTTRDDRVVLGNAARIAVDAMRSLKRRRCYLEACPRLMLMCCDHASHPLPVGLGSGHYCSALPMASCGPGLREAPTRPKR